MNAPGLTESFSPELKYLAQCLGNKKINQSPHLDWNEWISLVGYHRLLPWAHELVNSKTNEIPPQFSDIVRSRFRRFVERADLQIQELCKVNSILQKTLPVITLKGQTTSLLFYQNVYSRVSADIDLMVHQKDIFRADELFLTNGYQRTYPDFPLTPAQQKLFIDTEHHFGYIHPHRNIPIELHWRLFKNKHLLPVDFHTLCNETTEVPINEIFLKSLNRGMLAFYILVHGAQHGWYRLGWLRDVQVLLQQQDIDWKKIMEWAEKFNCTHLVAQGIYLSKDILGSEIPDPVLKLFPQTSRVESLKKKAVRFLLKKESKGKNTGTIMTSIDLLLYRSRLKKSLRYKLGQFSFRSVNDIRLLPLPGSLSFLYIPLRPILWIFRYFEKVFTRKK